MYDFRKWTPQRRAAIVEERVDRGYPWHSPPHFEAPGEYRIVTGACFEHRHILQSPERLGWFEEQLLGLVREQECTCAAWVVLPNHYHIVTKIDDMNRFARAIGQLHGGTSFEMNRKDDARGRQVWFRSQDRCMRSERHLYTTLNYIHNNPVKHGYVTKWTDWPFSSVRWYL